MSNESKPYEPIKGTKLALNPTTRAYNRRLNEIIVKYPGSDMEERAGICRVEGWEPEKRIPEMSQEPKLKISAIEQMCRRLEGKPEDLEKELNGLVKQFKKKEPVEALSADEYWLEMCKALFEGFPADADPDDINFREVRRAYEDFHEG